MTTSSLLGLYHGMLVVYVLAIVCLNLIAFLISDFYRKKFSQPAPRFWFLAAIVLGLAIAVSQLFRADNAPTVERVQNVLFITASIMSLISAIGLYITMRKVRK
jgi:D-alanyl-lipoteichoic acid acyltransferase DltB (MBOAT superfamily)